MKDLEGHLMASKSRISRRASLGQNISSAKSLPAHPSKHKQLRRTSLSGFNASIGSVSSSAPRVEVEMKQPPTITHTPEVASVPKKQMRRASLGQLLGNAQRFFGNKDDAATCITTEESTCNDAASVMSHDTTAATTSTSSVVNVQQEARALLKEVVQTIQRHEQRKVEMEQSTESNLELAKARLSSGNRFGAVLSMRRVHKNTTMIAYTAAARYQLAQIRDNLQNLIVVTSSSSSSSSSPSSCVATEESGGTTTVTEYHKAIRNITESLLQADAPTPDDEFLLRQLESQMEEVGV